MNAYNHVTKNIIQFPAGILQDMFFDNRQPMYLNFGAIGSVIGHEITHGFDDMGRQMDKDGNNNNWWGQETSDKFKEKAECIVKSYSNFSVEGSDGKLKVRSLNVMPPLQTVLTKVVPIVPEGREPAG